MKIHRAVLAASLLLCAIPLAASAAALHTAEIGYSNVGIDLGGLHTSLPAGYVAFGSQIGDGFLGDVRLTAGAGKGLSFYSARALVGRPDVLEQGLAVMPFVSTSYTWIDGLNVREGTAAVGGAVYWQPFHDLQLSARADFGRDFGNASGGLYYGLHTGASMPIGPGSFSVSYTNRNLPVGPIALQENVFGAGYSIPF